MAKMTPLEKAAMEDQAGAERKKGLSSGASDRMLSAGKAALDEQRRETRGKALDIESRAKTSYKDPYTVTEGMKKGGKVSSASSRADGCAVKGKTKGRYL
jgi:hypothetical protein